MLRVLLMNVAVFKCNNPNFIIQTTLLVPLLVRRGNLPDGNHDK